MCSRLQGRYQFGNPPIRIGVHIIEPLVLYKFYEKSREKQVVFILDDLFQTLVHFAPTFRKSRSIDQTKSAL